MHKRHFYDLYETFTSLMVTKASPFLCFIRLQPDQTDPHRGLWASGRRAWTGWGPAATAPPATACSSSCSDFLWCTSSWSRPGGRTVCPQVCHPKPSPLAVPSAPPLASHRTLRKPICRENQTVITHVDGMLLDGREVIREILFNECHCQFWYDLITFWCKCFFLNTASNWVWDSLKQVQLGCKQHFEMHVQAYSPFYTPAPSVLTLDT